MARRADKKGVVLMLAFISLFFVVLTVLGFRGYRTAIAETEFLKNGTRVQAEIFEVYPLNEDWGCRYRYEDRNGRIYMGGTGKLYRRLSDAESRLGEKITIVIDGNGKSMRADYEPQTGVLTMGIVGASVIAICWTVIAVLVGLMIRERRRLRASGKDVAIQKAPIIVFAAFFACVAFLFAGMLAGKTWMIIGSIVALFGGGFLLAIGIVVRIALQMRKGLKSSYTAEPNTAEQDDTETGGVESPISVFEEYGEHTDGQENQTDARDEEEKQIEKINSTYGAENQYETARYHIKHASNAYRLSNRKEKILGFLLVGVLLALFAGVPISMSTGHIVLGFVCLGGFAGIIILAMVIVTVRQRISMSGKGYDPLSAKKGRVIACTLSGQSSVNDRITSTVYKVRIDVDGEEKIAYSWEYYNQGDEIFVLSHKKRKNPVSIIDKPEEPFDVQERLAELGESTRISPEGREVILRMRERLEKRKALLADEQARKIEDSEQADEQAREPVREESETENRESENIDTKEREAETEMPVSEKKTQGVRKPRKLR